MSARTIQKMFYCRRQNKLKSTRLKMFTSQTWEWNESAHLSSGKQSKCISTSIREAFVDIFTSALAREVKSISAPFILFFLITKVKKYVLVFFLFPGKRPVTLTIKHLKKTFDKQLKVLPSGLAVLHKADPEHWVLFMWEHKKVDRTKERKKDWRKKRGGF